MKNICLLLFICISIANNSFSQGNYNWITPNKTYLKLYVNTDGIQRINRSDFANAGINTGNIDPRTVKVLYRGSQIPVYFQGEENGVFDDTDFMDFYGRRNSGGLTSYLDANSNTTVYTKDEYYDLYSDTSVYWVDWGGSNGLRMQRSDYNSPLNFSDPAFYNKLHFEKDTYYYLGETTNPNSDFRYFSTELVTGESWYWKTLTTEETLEENFQINDLAAVSQQCSLKIFVYPRSFTNTVLNEHQLIIKINNNTVDTLKRDNLRRFDTTIVFSSSLLLNGSQNTISIKYLPLNNTTFTPLVDVDFFELTYPRDFTIRNNFISVNLTGSDSTSKKFSLPGHNSVNQTNIYDIRNNIRIEAYSSSGGILTFSGKSNSAFEVTNSVITRKPFKIVSRQVKDLVSNPGGADFIVVYQKLFESQAEQLRNHRQGFNGYRSVKAEIEDVYDIFNYGMESPVAVRNFIKHAYENWPLPRLKYLCLLGRASLDPKKNSSSSAYYQNFIPTYGNPPSDGYFANFNIGTFTYFHQISVGRLPVYNVSEAQNAINKIISYDLQSPERWWKRSIFITGGPTRSQQISFQTKSNNLINQYIAPPPVSGAVSKIYRNDSTGYITYNYKDSIKREFDRGAMIVNFIGHAAAQDWEIGLEDPNSLNNGGKLPLVLSFTCFTGRNAESNFRSFGENFMLLPNKCAVGFVGTTGWSFSGAGDSFNEYILKNFSRDSVRSIGDMVSFASKSMSRDSNSFTIRNTINCYNLIGDPATNLLIPNKPEFDLKQNDYTLSNPFPALGENIKMTVLPKNLGTAIDSVRIRFNLKKSGLVIKSTDTLVRNFYYLDTVNHFFRIDSVGNYNMTVVMDPNHSYVQKFYDNDSVTFPLTLRNLSFVQLKPLNNALLKSAEFRFTGLNPNVNLKTNNVKIILQSDTSSKFNSPVLQTFVNSNISGVQSGFNISIPVQIINTVYFLRTNAVINNDSSGWSDISKVIYNPGITSDFNRMSDSAYTVYKLKPGQYSESDLSNVSYSPEGFVLSKFNGNLYIRSYGSSGDQASLFTINSINYYSDGGSNTGLNIAKVKKLTGQASEIKNFRMTSPSSSDSVLAFLNTFNNTDYIMAYNASYVAGADSLRQNAISKFAEFGSRYIDSIQLGWFDSWAFYGFLGADTTQTCESYHLLSAGGWEPVICQINPEFQQTSGYISQLFGPAFRWKNFSWEQFLNPNSKITFDVYGINRDNTGTLLYQDLSGNELVNTDTINTFLYPNLKLNAKLSIDTLTGLNSPVFKSLNFKYYPPAELVPDNNSFTGTDTAVQEGDSVSFAVNYYNVGYKDIQKHISKWYVKNQGIEKILKADTINSVLQTDSMRSSKVTFSTAGLRESKAAIDTIDLYFETIPADNENEIFTFNNIAITQFVVAGDSINPNMDITYDGKKINNGDYVQSNPEIKLQFFDNSSMVISDTSNVKVYKFNFQTQLYNYIPYYINNVKNPEIEILFPDNSFLQATVIYKPLLTKGEHRFRFVSSDVSGNLADSVLNTVFVNDKMTIFDMANYPNPMKTETNFMFRLSGELNPSSCKLKIYTVTGRLIREINTPASVGYNNIYWDGKDNDGDYLANGTYLYKFIIQGDSQTETSVQKLAILR
ncbi:MAG: hypothetical protein JST15_10350 [Bacteroidetes bacterium]|nr:hypothetical protein [Bacteroidota bacterium]